MRKGSVTQLVSHWEGLQPPPASAARASASGSPSTQTHQPDVVALIISLMASSSAAIASLEAESAAQRAAAEATAHKRLEKLLRAAGRKSEKATKAHEEVALKHAALESAFAAREVTEVTTLQSARADHRVALEQLREKLGAQEDEAADLEETVARQRRSIETLTATLAERERELQRAAGRSAAAAAAADGGDAAVLSLEQRVAANEARTQDQGTLLTSCADGLSAAQLHINRKVEASHLMKLKGSFESALQQTFQRVRACGGGWGGEWREGAREGERRRVRALLLLLLLLLWGCSRSLVLPQPLPRGSTLRMLGSRWGTGAAERCCCCCCCCCCVCGCSRSIARATLRVCRSPQRHSLSHTPHVATFHYLPPTH